MQAVVKFYKKAGFKDEDIVLLWDPTKEQIDYHIKQVQYMCADLRKSESQEKVFFGFFFAGHGVVTKKGELEIVLEGDVYVNVGHKIRKGLLPAYDKIRSLSIFDCCRTPKPEDDGKK